MLVAGRAEVDGEVYNGNFVEPLLQRTIGEDKVPDVRANVRVYLPRRRERIVIGPLNLRGPSR